MRPRNLAWLLSVLALPASWNLPAAPDGAALYAAHCAVCHGDAGGGGVGVPLSLPSFLSTVDDAYLAKTIRLGRPGRVMPAFQRLSDSQVAAIVGHIRSWGDGPAPTFDPTPVRGDTERGKALYADYCASCHGADGAGGQGTGVTFSRRRDLPIIAPALNNPGFRASISDEMIKHTLMVGREATPMASFLVHGLDEGDINDIVRFLHTLEPTPYDPPADSNPVLLVESPNAFEDTVAAVRQAIEANNFRFIRKQLHEEGVVPSGEENPKRVMLYFCNFKFLFDALAIDPRVGMFLPCRITVEERADGVVTISAINPLVLSHLFNNDELNEACKTMYGIYQQLLEEASI